MTRKIDWSALSRGKATVGFITDIVMVMLVFLNLGFIIFDWHFGFSFFKKIVEAVSPAFYSFYSGHVHPNFLLYDAVFVTIFIAELLIRWMLAVKRKTYGKWFFYPFIHWYDVLGCIPLGTFRWLRILRVISMTIRLHKLGAINLTDTHVYREGQKIIRVLTEEISDRVVMNVLNGVQREIRNDNPISSRMITEVIRPHQDTLTIWLSHRIRKVTEHNYSQYHKEIQSYMESVIREAVKQNDEVKNIASIPLVGSQISKALEKSVGDITFNVVNGMVRDLASDHNNKFIEEVTNIVFESILLQEEDKELNRVTKDVFIRAIDLVKEQVEVKQWKLEEQLAA